MEYVEILSKEPIMEPNIIGIILVVIGAVLVGVFMGIISITPDKDIKSIWWPVVVCIIGVIVIIGGISMSTRETGRYKYKCKIISRYNS